MSITATIQARVHDTKYKQNSAGDISAWRNALIPRTARILTRGSCQAVPGRDYVVEAGKANIALLLQAPPIVIPSHYHGQVLGTCPRWAAGIAPLRPTRADGAHLPYLHQLRARAAKVAAGSAMENSSKGYGTIGTRCQPSKRPQPQMRGSHQRRMKSTILKGPATASTSAIAAHRRASLMQLVGVL